MARPQRQLAEAVEEAALEVIPQVAELRGLLLPAAVPRSCQAAELVAQVAAVAVVVLVA